MHSLSNKYTHIVLQGHPIKKGEFYSFKKKGRVNLIIPLNDFIFQESDD